MARADEKGRDCARAAVELANLLSALEPEDDFYDDFDDHDFDGEDVDDDLDDDDLDEDEDEDVDDK